MSIHQIPLEFGRLKSYSYWWTYIRSRKLWYILGSLSVLVTNVTEVLVPKVVQYFIDLFSGRPIPTYLDKGAKASSLEYLFYILIAVLLVQMLFRGLWRVTLARETHVAAASMRSSMWSRVKFYKKKSFEGKFSLGHLMNIATSDIGRGRFVFGFTMVMITNMVFLGILSLVSIFLISVKIALLSLLVFLLLPIAIHKLVKAYDEAYERGQEKLSKLDELASQAIATVKLQRLTQSQKFWAKNLGDMAETYRRAALKSTMASLRFILVLDASPLLSYAVLFSVGLKMLISGELSVGQFVALQSYVYLLQIPMQELGFLIAEWKRGFTSIRRFLETLNEEQDPHLLKATGAQASSKENVLSVRNLKFRYHDSKKNVLENLNFSLKKGERLGIHGPVGSGKSTLLQILTGLEDSYDGEVDVYGGDMRSYASKDLRNWISMVPQKVFLFADTVRNNIQLDKTLTDEEIYYYLDIAGVKEDIIELPDKLDTYLGEWGVNLSGGQKQRLSIARALAQKKPILYFDDCLSAVDTATEEKILKNLDRELKDTSLIWVAHRTSTLKYCHQKLELRND